MTRDRWLADLVGLMRSEIRRLTGLKVPGLSITASRDAMRDEMALGMCSVDRAGLGVKTTVKVAAGITDPRELAHVVAHELLHAAMPHAGHDWTFRDGAQRLGLSIRDENGVTAPTPAFDAWALPLLDRLPPYPPETRSQLIQRLRPLPWLGGYLVAALLVAVVGFQLARPSVHYALAYTVFGFSPLMLLLSPAVILLPGALVAIGLTDSHYARSPRARIVAQIAAVFVPIVAGLLVWLWWSLPGNADTLAANVVDAIRARRPEFLAANGVPDLTRSGVHLAASAGAFAALKAYAFFSIPLALVLWFTRPVCRFYQVGRFVAPTPPFLIHGRHKSSGVYGFSRSNPRHLGLMLALISNAARIERAFLGLDVVNRGGEALQPELLPASGFLIEDHGDGSAIVAAGLKREVSKDETTALQKLGHSFRVTHPGQPRTTPTLTLVLFGVAGLLIRRGQWPFAANPLNRADTIQVQRVAGDNRAGDPLAPASTEKGGARFGWVFGGQE